MIPPSQIWSSSNLPTLPSVAVNLLKLSQNSNTDIHEVARVIKTDPAITAKILKSTNSSYFAFRNEVTSIDHAVPLLGATMVTSLALSFSLVEGAMTSGPLADHYKNYWMKSVVQAVAAEILGERTRVKDQFFLAGLLADLGRLAMLKSLGHTYADVLDDAEKSQRDPLEVEREKLGFDYVDIGIQLMDRWKLPDPLIRAAIARKWTLAELKEKIDEGNKELLSVIAVAAAVSEYFCTSNKGPALERMRELTSHFFGMTQAQLEEFLDQVKVRMDDAAGTFSVDSNDLGDPVELMALANEHLARMALREHVASTQAQERQRLAEEQNAKLAEENELLQKQALHDPLTKLYNRSYFEDALKREVLRCQRTADPIAVVFSDIDHFKSLNDTYGHQFGDRVLKEVALVFQSVLRTSDVLARFGGEEFVILAVQPTEKGLEKVVERVRAGVETHEIYFEGRRVPLSISVGAAMAIPRRNSENLGEQLIAEADDAMYESKRKGRNRITIRCLLDEDERRLVQQVLQCRFSRWLVRRQILDIPTVSKALLSSQTPRICVGELACQYGCLDPAAVEKVLQEQKTTDERFGKAAVRLGLLTETQLAQLLAWQGEDPKLLALHLVRSGLLDRPDAEMLLHQYLGESSFGRDALSEMEIASFL